MLLNIIFVFFSALGLHADEAFPYSLNREKEVLSDFKVLLIDIREQRLSPAVAKEHFVEIMKELRAVYPLNADTNQIPNLIFPLIKSRISSVGGAGKGFYARQFDLFDASIKKSHPAHDIFIYDPDQDSKDNRIKDYVDIVSVSNGVVIATEKDWTPSSDYRGGNYVWIYDFDRGGLWYYAHQREVVVEPGQIVKAGDKLGQVGRTGFNAQNPRSDTHLHLMYLRLDENLHPFAVNYYSWLQKATILKEATTATPNQWREKGLEQEAASKSDTSSNVNDPREKK